MKKILSVLMILCMLCACSVALAEGESLRLCDVTSDGEYVISLTRVARLSAPNEFGRYNYRVQQGSATDGTYAYTVMEDQVQSLGSIHKLDLNTWEVVQSQFDLKLDHGNDMTYNPKTGKLVVVNNKPNYNILSIVNPETLEIEDKIRCSVKMFSIAYNETRDVYVVGNSGSQNFSILDADFKEIGFYSVVHDGLVTQGVDCDDKYIYFPRCDKKATKNIIAVYDWDGNHVTNITVKSFQEIESMFHVGDDIYIAFNAGGSYIYKGTLTRK